MAATDPTVHRRMIAGPADLFALHRLSPAAYPFLLQSVAGHPQSGRYDILFAEPGEVLEERGGVLSGPGAGAFPLPARRSSATRAWARLRSSSTVMKAGPLVSGGAGRCSFKRSPLSCNPPE